MSASTPSTTFQEPGCVSLPHKVSPPSGALPGLHLTFPCDRHVCGANLPGVSVLPRCAWFHLCAQRPWTLSGLAPGAGLLSMFKATPSKGCYVAAERAPSWGDSTPAPVPLHPAPIPSHNKPIPGGRVRLPTSTSPPRWCRGCVSTALFVSCHSPWWPLRGSLAHEQVGPCDALDALCSFLPGDVHAPAALVPAH